MISDIDGNLLISKTKMLTQTGSFQKRKCYSVDKKEQRFGALRK